MSVSVMELLQLFFIRDVTKNSEFENTPAWLLSNILRLHQVRDTKFGMDVIQCNLV